MAGGGLRPAGRHGDLPLPGSRVVPTAVGRLVRIEIISDDPNAMDTTPRRLRLHRHRDDQYRKLLSRTPKLSSLAAKS